MVSKYELIRLRRHIQERDPPNAFIVESTDVHVTGKFLSNFSSANVKQVLVEICCGSAEDAIEAWHGGADRVELCSALFLGRFNTIAGVVTGTKSTSRD